MKNNPFPIKQCQKLDLKFDENGTAYSNNYNDIYFQPGIGLEEKEHVFLKGNNIHNNWRDKNYFTIAETGFGIGLNFLSTLKLWHQTSKPNQQLHYLSCELLPLNKQQLSKALKNFPEISHYSQQLISHYPDLLIYGSHRIHFKEFNVTLTLIFGDCIDALNSMNAVVDAWYLDGFAPSKNPVMWSKKLFKIISNLSQIGTILATYTVAGKVRQGLTDVGFEIKKVKGYGKKREILTATLKTHHPLNELKPWHQTNQSTNTDSITIIGAGIAGLSIAQKFNEYNQDVTLIDRQAHPCLESSGNPQAMVMPSFDLNDSPESQFHLTAFLYAIRHYSRKHYHRVGVYQLASTKKQQLWQDKFLSRFDLPRELVHKYKKGLLYQLAGWLDTQAHAKCIFNRLNNFLQAEITSIEYKDNLWHLYNNHSIIHTTKTLIIANGISTKKLVPNYDIPIIPKHGQISYFKSTDIDPQIAHCHHVQLNKGYITPSLNNEQTIGATFNHLDKESWFKTPLLYDNHWQKNTELWRNTDYYKMLMNITSQKSRAGIRVTTPDHMPICGAIINQKKFQQDYHDLRHGKKWKHYPTPLALENLYLTTGLGSRGFTTAPILAEYLCNQILGHPQLLNKHMQRIIHPNRFLYRKLQRK